MFVRHADNIYIIYVSIFSMLTCWHTCRQQKVCIICKFIYDTRRIHTYMRTPASLWCSNCCDAMTPYKLLTNADFKFNWLIHWRDHSSMQENGLKNVLLALQVWLCVVEGMELVQNTVLYTYNNYSIVTVCIHCRRWVKMMFCPLPEDSEGL